MLRMRAGETSFDSDWSRNFSEALDMRLWTGVTPGLDGKMYIQSMEEDAPEVVAAVEDSDPFGIANAQAWTWHALSDADATPAAVDADFLSAPPVFAPIPVGESAYVSLWDGADTTLVDLASTENPEEGLVVRGFAYNVVKID
jgi:hypothetical protein